jgi:hypothetical protein
LVRPESVRKRLNKLYEYLDFVRAIAYDGCGSVCATWCNSDAFLPVFSRDQVWLWRDYSIGHEAHSCDKRCLVVP